jgi:transcriptional regulator with XRE-family HTH domain
MEIGKRLRELRMAQGLAQSEIARRAGFLPCYLSRIEHGHATPQLAVLERWANALGIPLYAIFMDRADDPSLQSHRQLVNMSPFEKDLFHAIRKMKPEEQRTFLSFAELLAEREDGRDGTG